MSTVGTVMFTDLRGFTAFAEGKPPELVIAALNRYFDETSDAILEHGGTLVAYRGDGFLAVFGAPIEVEDHADRALETARDMVNVRLPRFNGWLRENGLGDGIRMGVGLNSGPFMSGNVGSLRRLEYTVHGDTVNTASRIEGMTKTIGGPILLAESTRACAPPSAGRPPARGRVRSPRSGFDGLAVDRRRDFGLRPDPAGPALRLDRRCLVQRPQLLQPRVGELAGGSPCSRMAGHCEEKRLAIE